MSRLLCLFLLEMMTLSRCFCYRLSLDVKYMLFLVLQSHSLDLFVVMGYKNAERLVEGMAIYQVYCSLHALFGICVCLYTIT